MDENSDDDVVVNMAGILQKWGLPEDYVARLDDYRVMLHGDYQQERNFTAEDAAEIDARIKSCRYHMGANHRVMHDGDYQQERNLAGEDPVDLDPQHTSNRYHMGANYRVMPDGGYQQERNFTAEDAADLDARIKSCRYHMGANYRDYQQDRNFTAEDAADLDARNKSNRYHMDANYRMMLDRDYQQERNFTAEDAADLDARMKSCRCHMGANYREYQQERNFTAEDAMDLDARNKSNRYHMGAKLEKEKRRTPLFGQQPAWWGEDGNIIHQDGDGAYKGGRRKPATEPCLLQSCVPAHGRDYLDTLWLVAGYFKPVTIYSDSRHEPPEKLEAPPKFSLEPTDPTPTITQDPTPTITQHPIPTTMQSPHPIITQNPHPIITQNPTPAIAQNPTPTQEDANTVEEKSLRRERIRMDIPFRNDEDKTASAAAAAAREKAEQERRAHRESLGMAFTIEFTDDAATKMTDLKDDVRKPSSESAGKLPKHLQRRSMRKYGGSTQSDGAVVTKTILENVTVSDEKNARREKIRMDIPFHDDDDKAESAAAAAAKEKAEQERRAHRESLGMAFTIEFTDNAATKMTELKDDAGKLPKHLQRRSMRKQGSINQSDGVVVSKTIPENIAVSDMNEKSKEESAAPPVAYSAPSTVPKKAKSGKEYLIDKMLSSPANEAATDWVEPDIDEPVDGPCSIPDAPDCDTSVKKDNDATSDAGTYTIDNDPAAETDEIKARMAIEKVFNVTGELDLEISSDKSSKTPSPPPIYPVGDDTRPTAVISPSKLRQNVEARSQSGSKDSSGNTTPLSRRRASAPPKSHQQQRQASSNRAACPPTFQQVKSHHCATPGSKPPTGSPVATDSPKSQQAPPSPESLDDESVRTSLLNKLLKITHDEVEPKRHPVAPPRVHLRAKDDSTIQRQLPTTNRRSLSFVRAQSGRPRADMTKSSTPGVIGRSAHGAAGSNTPFLRSDGGRYSMRSATTPVGVRPSSDAHHNRVSAPPQIAPKAAAAKPPVSQAPGGAKPEMKAWLRRKGYDPLKAVAEAKKSKPKLKNPVSTIKESLRESDAPFISKRSASFHAGVAASSPSRNNSIGGVSSSISNSGSVDLVEEEEISEQEYCEDPTGAVAGYSRTVTEKLSRLTSSPVHVDVPPLASQDDSIVDNSSRPSCGSVISIDATSMQTIMELSYQLANFANQTVKRLRDANITDPQLNEDQYHVSKSISGFSLDADSLERSLCSPASSSVPPATFDTNRAVNQLEYCKRVFKVVNETVLAQRAPSSCGDEEIPPSPPVGRSAPSSHSDSPGRSPIRRHHEDGGDDSNFHSARSGPPSYVSSPVDDTTSTTTTDSPSASTSASDQRSDGEACRLTESLSRLKPYWEKRSNVYSAVSATRLERL